MPDTREKAPGVWRLHRLERGKGCKALPIATRFDVSNSTWKTKTSMTGQSVSLHLCMAFLYRPSRNDTSISPASDGTTAQLGPAGA